MVLLIEILVLVIEIFTFQKSLASPIIELFKKKKKVFVKQETTPIHEQLLRY